MEVINLMVPVITIDGPASSGKGTVAKLLAKGLGFHYLESGAIYRALGLWVYRNYGDTSVDESEVVKLIATMKLQFSEVGIILNGENVTDTLREEFVGMLASKYGSIPDVRTRLLQFQRDFAKEPGLVTDGRLVRTSGIEPYFDASIMSLIKSSGF
jgi:cytidylate kinase